MKVLLTEKQMKRLVDKLVKTEFTLKLYDDESTKKKLKTMNSLQHQK